MSAVLPPQPGSVVHIAGLMVTIGAMSRQRCAWCGESLLDAPPGFPDRMRRQIAAALDATGISPGAYVRVVTTGPDDQSRGVVGRVGEDPLPDDSCVWALDEDIHAALGLDGMQDGPTADYGDG